MGSFYVLAIVLLVAVATKAIPLESNDGVAVQEQSIRFQGQPNVYDVKSDLKRTVKVNNRTHHAAHNNITGTQTAGHNTWQNNHNGTQTAGHNTWQNNHNGTQTTGHNTGHNNQNGTQTAGHNTWHNNHNGTQTAGHNNHNGTQTAGHNNHNGTQTAGHKTGHNNHTGHNVHHGTHTTTHAPSTGHNSGHHATSVTYHPPAVGFHVVLTPDYLTIPHDETVVFDHSLVNIGGAYDVTHGHFTATISGLYSFTAHIEFRSSDTATLDVSIVKNGDNLGRVYLFGSGTSIRTVVVFLDVGDIVWLKNNVDNHPRMYGEGLSTFSGFLIAPVH